jgi:hypothetical protein
VPSAIGRRLWRHRSTTGSSSKALKNLGMGEVPFAISFHR